MLCPMMTLCPMMFCLMMVSHDVLSIDVVSYNDFVSCDVLYFDVVSYDDFVSCDVLSFDVLCYICLCIIKKMCMRKQFQTGDFWPFLIENKQTGTLTNSI